MWCYLGMVSYALLMVQDQFKHDCNRLVCTTISVWAARKSEHAAAARLVCHGENWKEGSWKQRNNRLGNADDWEEVIKPYINVSCVQLYVEFADLEVLLIIILHLSVKQGQEICVNLCYGTKQWGPVPAHSLQCPELLHWFINNCQ